MRVPRDLEIHPRNGVAASTGASMAIDRSPGGVTVSWVDPDDPDEPLPPLMAEVDREAQLAWKRQVLSEIVSDLQWRVSRLLAEVETAEVA